MADKQYSIEVQDDFLQKITHAEPIQALAELIWNSLDADASRVDVRFEHNSLGRLSKITVADNGTGMVHEEAPQLFGRLGGSWKREQRRTKERHRNVHGREGRGRFKALALGRIAEWIVTYRKKAKLLTFTITLNREGIRQVTISDQKVEVDRPHTGVTLHVLEPHKDFRSITSASAFQQLTEMFALYLTDYSEVAIYVDGRQIDPSGLIISREIVELKSITDDAGKRYPVQLEIVEWRTTSNRILYLCTENGFPLSQVDDQFNTLRFSFSSYLKSAYVSRLEELELIDIAEMDKRILASANEARDLIKRFFAGREAQEARNVLDTWKEENIYPYEGDSSTVIETAEREVFDIVAVKIAQAIPEFSAAPQKSRALNLRLLRYAIEKGPVELQTILEQVLNLSQDKQKEFADLLQNVSLSGIISAAKIVTDRLHFLDALEAILFGAESKKRLKERSQLHRIISQNCWLFGEEFSLSVDDQSLTEVLRKHKAMLGEDIIIDAPVKHVSKKSGIVDLMLSKASRDHRPNNLTHLVVELKRPSVKIGTREITQVEEYLLSIMDDERFHSVTTNWVFWVISNELNTYANFRMKTLDENGVVAKGPTHSLSVKTWAQVIDDNRARMQFFKERLELQADKDKSLKLLQEKYAQYLEGVIVEEEDVDQQDIKDDPQVSEGD